MNFFKKLIIKKCIQWVKSEAKKSNDLEQKVTLLFVSPAEKIVDLLTAPTSGHASVALEELVKQETVKFMTTAQQIAQEYKAQSTTSGLLNLSSKPQTSNYAIDKSE